jgi:hypothetical protein
LIAKGCAILEIAIESLQFLLGGVKRFKLLKRWDSLGFYKMVKHLFGLEEEDCEDCDCDECEEEEE